MSVPMSYSVWLKPAPDSALGRQLATMVARHAAELGTPAFTPHVTLLGGFTAEDDVRAPCCSISTAHSQPLLRVFSPLAGRGAARHTSAC